jgi:hypothetical protein
MKTCCRCKEIKDYDNFKKNRSRKDGYASNCRSCDKIDYEKNKEKNRERCKKWRENNIEKISERKKNYRKNNIEKVREQERNLYYKRIDYYIKYREDNKEHYKKWREENKDKKHEYMKNYYEKNKEYIKDYNNKYQINRRKMDEGYRILHCLRARLNQALKGKNKYNTTMELVGCSMEFLKDYLENTKVPGKDYTNAHIDHIKPCASFDLTDPEQQKECFHYTNLQFLPAIENLQKGSKLQQLPSKGIFE